MLEILLCLSFSVKAKTAQIIAGKPSKTGILLLAPKQKIAMLNNEKITTPNLLTSITLIQQTIKVIETEMDKRPIT